MLNKYLWPNDKEISNNVGFVAHLKTLKLRNPEDFILLVPNNRKRGLAWQEKSRIEDEIKRLQPKTVSEEELKCAYSWNSSVDFLALRISERINNLEQCLFLSPHEGNEINMFLNLRGKISVKEIQDGMRYAEVFLLSQNIDLKENIAQRVL